MRGIEALYAALAGLRTHALRSILTALGIVFGVAAVISMLSIGEGARREALEQISALGIRNLIVHDELARAREDEDPRAARSSGLGRADARALATIHPLVERVVPLRAIEARARRGATTMNVELVGTTPELPLVREQELVEGRFLDDEDVATHGRVCVLGSAVRRELFPLGDALGAEIKISGQWLTVVGVMGRRDAGLDQGVHGGGGSATVTRDRASGTSVGTGDPNVEVYVPLSSVLRRFVHDASGSELSSLIVRVTDPDRSLEAADLLTRVLRRRHAEVDDFRVVVPEALLRQRQATQRIFNIVMGAIAGISLLVGGIGIMNIMLASVLERTREIGVRRAVGASRRDVLGQFLAEAVVVSVLGGVIGIALGFALTEIIASAAGWRTAVPPSAVVLAFGVSAAVGILFGWMPARRAASLDPIESLRYE